MKYSDAIKIALQNPEFKAMYSAFRAGGFTVNGSLQFSVDGEAFFYGFEKIYDEMTGETAIRFRGGKHNAYRAAVLIGRGESFVIR